MSALPEMYVQRPAGSTRQRLETPPNASIRLVVAG